jgi:hypothetical protein
MFHTYHKALVVAGLVFCSLSSAFAYSGGSGTPAAPYQIANNTDLLVLAVTTADYNKCFILTADINMGGEVFTTAIIAPDTISGSNFDGTAFTGTFDGNSHKITHFTINGGSNSYLGLFGQTNSGGSVKNLGLENFTVSGDGSYYVGGLVGANEGSISDCYSKGDVAGGEFSYYLGGLAGRNFGSINNCYSTGAVSGDSGSCVGGLVGSNSGGGSISNCYSTGAVSGDSSYVGGLVGYNSSSSISNCYSTGTVSGFYYVGGLVGYNAYGSISNCYSTGAVSGTSYVGGLVGYNNLAASVASSFWDTQTSGRTTSAGGTGKTTAEMKQINTFANWDFVETWGIEDNQTYPFLKLIYPVGDLNHDKVVNFLDFAILADHWLEGL